MKNATFDFIGSLVFHLIMTAAKCNDPNVFSTSVRLSTDAEQKKTSYNKNGTEDNTFSLFSFPLVHSNEILKCLLTSVVYSVI